MNVCMYFHELLESVFQMHFLNFLKKSTRLTIFQLKTKHINLKYILFLWTKCSKNEVYLT